MLSIVADAVDEIVPLVLPRTIAIFCGCPYDVVLLDPLILEHVDCGSVGSAGKLCGTLGAVNECSKFAACLGNSAKTTEGPGAISESVLHRVDINVLSVVCAIEYPATHADNRDRPGSFDPAALIDLVD